MFTLRFFAGPIVHKINPVGLLFASAVLGTLGLWLLGQPGVTGMWAWLGAVTIYGIGKTFYWPTLLGVISERFPKGGALALGISGGVGMMAAGLLGGPGIGYKQDYFAVQTLQETEASRDTYDRYVSRKENGEPDPKKFPLVTSVFPNEVPAIAGLDNAKLKVFNDYTANLEKVKKAQEQPPADGKEPPRLLSTSLEEYIAEVDAAKTAEKEPPNILLTTLESDLVTLMREKKAGNPVPEKLEQELTQRKQWWDTKGKPNYEADKPYLERATLEGPKTALLYTAAVPATLAVGFLLLLLYFAATGGYKQVHLEEEPPMGEY
jgi:hypothetical protein